MENNTADLSLQIREKLLRLMAQVSADREALRLQKGTKISASSLQNGDEAYGRLFDALQATLHNLDSTRVAEEI